MGTSAGSTIPFPGFSLTHVLVAAATDSNILFECNQDWSIWLEFRWPVSMDWLPNISSTKKYGSIGNYMSLNDSSF
jgi:hypothetical protein